MRKRSIPTILLVLVAGMSCVLCARAGTVTKSVANNETSYARVVRLSLVDGAVSIAHAGESY